MQRQPGASRLLLAGLAAILLAAVDAVAGLVAGDRPKIEAGVRVVALAQPNNPGVGGGAEVTWNLDPRTALEVSADFSPHSNERNSNVSAQLAYVQLKRALYASAGRVYGTFGVAGGIEHIRYPGYTFLTPNGPITIPATSYRRGIGGPVLGVGYDRILSSHFAFDVQAQFAITQERAVLRTLAGITVPIGRFTPRRERATPTLATFSEVEVGQTAWVTMADGRLWKGAITGMSTTTVDVARAGATTSLPLADVRKIEAPDRITDGAKRGAYIGLAAGIPALIFGAALCENEGSDCAGWAIATGALWSGIGAGLGSLIGAIADSLHEGRRVVYESGQTKLSIAPIVVRRGAGAGAVIRW